MRCLDTKQGTGRRVTAVESSQLFALLGEPALRTTRAGVNKVVVTF